MPFDNPPQPSTSVAVRTPAARPVGLWLVAMCGMLLVMVVLGGATRVTGSGLSIMEWAPFTGVFPPFSDAEWRRLYDLYEQIPQASLVNAGFGIEGFKHIFWLEWSHRLWGRLIGIAFIVPLAAFIWFGMVTRRLACRLAGLFALGGLQGAVGWFMVASGFAADSVSVSAYRLVVHLTLALALYSAILWTALDILSPQPCAALPSFRRLVAASAALVAVTIVAGGFVAGLHAGLAYNTFPLMAGTLPPPDYAALHPFVRNLTENVAAVQFDHRLLATLTALVAGAAAVWGLRVARGGARRAAVALGAAVAAQYALGVLTLLWVVPPALGAAHQAMAVLVLSAALAALHAQRRSASTAQAR